MIDLTKHGGIYSSVFFVCFTHSYAIQCSYMKKILVSVLSLSALVSLFFPMYISAQVGIPCGDIAGGQKECGFDDLIILTNNVIKFLMYSVAVPLAALGFMWIGGNLVLNQDKEGARNTAKEGFTNIGKGFLLMLGAYVLVKLVIYAFLNTKDGFFTFLVS